MKPFTNMINESKKLTKEDLEQNRRDLESYKRVNSTCVYVENQVPLGCTRVWISYDCHDDKLRNELVDLLYGESLKAECWGESVACVTLRMAYSKSEEVREHLKNLLVKNKILDQEDPLKTQGISLFMVYRSRTKENEKCSGSFVLIQNAYCWHLKEMLENSK